ARELTQRLSGEKNPHALKATLRGSRQNIRWAGRARGRGTQEKTAGSALRARLKSCPPKARVVLLGGPFGIELGDGGADGEAPSEDGEILEFVGNDVAVLRFLRGHAGFKHFFGLSGDVVEDFADAGDAFLAADLAVAGNENGFFVPGGEGLE